MAPEKTSEKGFRLKLTGQGVNVDRPVSAELAHQIVAMPLARRAFRLPNPGDRLPTPLLVAETHSPGLDEIPPRCVNSSCSKRRSAYLSKSRRWRYT
jgi:hypothetical protein